MPWCRCLSLFMLLLLLTAGPGGIGCRRAEVPPPSPISLLDGLDPKQPLGPWRVAAQVRGTHPWVDEAQGLGVELDGVVIPARERDGLSARQKKLVSRTLGKGGALVQTGPVSSLRMPVALAAGERPLLGIRYGAAMAGGTRIEARLLRDDEPVATVRAAVAGDWLEALLLSPPGGADALELRHHLPPGSEIILRDTALIVLDRGAADAAVERARLYLRLARGTPAAPVPRQRVEPLSRDGSTFETLLLSSGESVNLPLPGEPAGRRLRCWLTVLSADGAQPAVLTLAADTGEGDPRVLLRAAVDAGGVGRWSEFLLEGDRGLPPDCRGLTVTLTGGDAVAGISGPLLLPERRPGGRKNLLVIDLDTLRADRMATYGYEGWPTTAGLDEWLLENGGHLFEHAYSPAVSTLPATAKFLAGRYHDVHRQRTVPRGYDLLQERLRRHGYYCVAFTGGGQLRSTGFEQGFHEYHWSREVGKLEDSFPRAEAWLAANGGERFFLFLHTYETHAPYTRGDFCAGLPRGRLGDLMAGEPLIPDGSGIGNRSELDEAERRYVNAAYDGGVKTATEGVRDLLASLRRLGLGENTVAVILSDHGEEFWDHHQLFAQHGQSLYGELLNVPLIIIDPDHPAGGLHRIGEEVSTVDLLPTVLDLLGLDAAADTDGVSLAPLLGERGTGNAFRREIPVIASRMQDECCVVRGGVKFIAPLGPEPWRTGACGLPGGVGELYHLGEDPGERTNLAATRPELRQEMAELLHRAATGALPPLEGEAAGREPADPDLRRQLRALGYVDGD